jgi:hypothetical protein
MTAKKFYPFTLDKATKGGNGVKNGKRPSRRHKLIMIKAGLNPNNWLITKNLHDQIHLVHKYSDQEQVLPLRQVQ